MRRIIYAILIVVYLATPASAYHIGAVSGDGSVYFNKKGLSMVDIASSSHFSQWRPMPVTDPGTGHVSVSFDIYQDSPTPIEDHIYLETSFQVLSDYGNVAPEALDVRLTQWVDYTGETDSMHVPSAPYAQGGTNRIEWSLQNDFGAAPLIGSVEDNETDLEATDYSRETISIYSNTKYSMSTTIDTSAFTWFEVATMLGLTTEFESYDDYWAYYGSFTGIDLFQRESWAWAFSNSYLSVVSEENAPSPVPEPSTLLLLSLGLPVVARSIRARRKSAQEH